MRGMMKSAFLALFLWALAWPLAAQAPHFDRSMLTIRTVESKEIALDVEWAITADQRAHSRTRSRTRPSPNSPASAVIRASRSTARSRLIR